MRTEIYSNVTEKLHAQYGNKFVLKHTVFWDGDKYCRLLSRSRSTAGVVCGLENRFFLLLFFTSMLHFSSKTEPWSKTKLMCQDVRRWPASFIQHCFSNFPAGSQGLGENWTPNPFWILLLSCTGSRSTTPPSPAAVISSLYLWMLFFAWFYFLLNFNLWPQSYFSYFTTTVFVRRNFNVYKCLWCGRKTYFTLEMLKKLKRKYNQIIFFSAWCYFKICIHIVFFWSVSGGCMHLR